MHTTFYGVLGVGPDADDDAIRTAYRERVKDHHPDVSAAPDAADRFKRITTAKEALLDGNERSRYDRLGHVAYVRTYGDSSLWRLDDHEWGDDSHTTASGRSAKSCTATDASRATTEGRTNRSRTQSADSQRRGSSSRTGRNGSGTDERNSKTDGSRSRTRSSGARERASQGTDRTSRAADRTTGSRSGAKRSGGNSGDSTGRTSSSQNQSSSSGPDSTTATASSTSTASTTSSASSASSASTSSSASTDPSASSASTTSPKQTSRASNDPSSDEDSSTSPAETAESTETQSDSRSERSRRPGADTGQSGGGARRRRTAPSSESYANSSFWHAAEADHGYERATDPLLDRLLAGLWTLGAWVVIHALFLSLAVGTGWYVYMVILPPVERSLALLFVLVGEVGLTVLLSSLHILTRIYR